MQFITIKNYIRRRMKISIGTSVFQGRILFIESYITYPAKSDWIDSYISVIKKLNFYLTNASKAVKIIQIRNSSRSYLTNLVLFVRKNYFIIKLLSFQSMLYNQSNSTFYTAKCVIILRKWCTALFKNWTNSLLNSA